MTTSIRLVSLKSLAPGSIFTILNKDGEISGNSFYCHKVFQDLDSGKKIFVCFDNSLQEEVVFPFNLRVIPISSSSFVVPKAFSIPKN